MSTLKTKEIVLVFGILGILLSGCITSRPNKREELYPQLRFNSNPKVGLLIFPDTAPAVVELFDKAGRFIYGFTEIGAEPNYTINGKTKVRIYIIEFELGEYKIKGESFCYDPYRRDRDGKLKLVELGSIRKKFTVNADPRDYHDRKYTGKKWAFICVVRTRKIPKKYRGAIKTNLKSFLINGPYVEIIDLRGVIQ